LHSPFVAAARIVPSLRQGLVVRRWSLRARLLFVVFLGVVIGGTAAWWGFPSVAHAATCDVHYNVVATDSVSNHGHNGVRVSNPGMYIYNYTAYCVHDSSLLSEATTGDWAEVGWRDPATGYQACGVTGDNTPHILVTWVNGGVYTCHQYGALTANQSDDFSVWGDSSDLWHWAHNGSNITTHTLDFRASYSFTNGERHSSYESAEALFDGMQNGTSPNWNVWTSSACFSDNDPSYNNQLQSHTKISVSQGASQC
jgi:hypothetical protein